MGKILYNAIGNGYNLKEGGANGRLSEESRKKISETLKGKHLSEESRKKISKTLKGKRRHEETRRKISEARKGKFIGEKSPRAKKVLCIETNEIFSCGKECAEKMNISYSGLVMCCQRNAKSTDNHYTAGGYHFIYVEE